MARPFSMLVDPHGPRPIAPPYREAYPALSVVGARSAWQKGLRLCEWHNERIELVARMELIACSDTMLDLTCEWSADGARQQARAMFDILHRPSLTDRRLPDAMCDGCRTTSSTLYLVKGAWHCAQCHKLTARAALLTRQEKQLLQMRRLHSKIGGRAPPVRGFRTWDIKRLKLTMLMDRLRAEDGVELRECVRAQVVAGWVDHPFDAEEDHALTGIGYDEAPTPIPRASPWFGGPRG